MPQEAWTKQFKNLIERTRGKLCETSIFDHTDRNVREEKSHWEVRESRFFAQRLLDRDKGEEGTRERERETVGERKR